MIEPIDNVMNSVACFEAPIVDAVSEISFFLAGITSAYGLYKLATGNTPEGTTYTITGVLGLLTTSYTKEISQSVMKSCRV